MKIIVDENISYAEEAFHKFGEVLLLPGRKITRDILKDADILIIRSVTKINRKLIQGTSIKFIGTATIGTDHVDEEFLKTENIKFVSAKGCNSTAVTEYVMSSVFQLAEKWDYNIEGKSIGIIGVGNIGSKVAKLAAILGIKVYLNDPPLQRTTGSSIYCDLNTALSADIITCHVPLNMEGIDKTYHLLDEKELKEINEDAILINSSRGSVINNYALRNILKKKHNLSTVIDVWENEPELDIELLDSVNIATQHIAGYSLEGKVNGTTMIYQQLCDFLRKEPVWKPQLPQVPKNIFEINSRENVIKSLQKITSEISHLKHDTLALKRSKEISAANRANYFDDLRKTYNLRREFYNYVIKSASLKDQVKKMISDLGFQIK